MQNPSFSERNGYKTKAAPITVRHDAPQEFREWIGDYLLSSDEFSCQYITNIVRKKAMLPPTENKNRSWIDPDMFEGIKALDWFEVYELIEEVVAGINRFDRENFINGINKYFLKKGYGYIIRLGDGKYEVFYRGDDEFESIVSDSVQASKDEGIAHAAKELIHAGLEMSARPEPNYKGAIRYAVAYLESIANSREGDRMTLGDWVNEKLKPRLQALEGRGALPKKISGFYGYASEIGRHGNHIEPSEEEAQYCILQASIYGKLIQYYWPI